MSLLKEWQVRFHLGADTAFGRCPPSVAVSWQRAGGKSGLEPPFLICFRQSSSQSPSHVLEQGMIREHNSMSSRCKYMCKCSPKRDHRYGTCVRSKDAVRSSVLLIDCCSTAVLLHLQIDKIHPPPLTPPPTTLSLDFAAWGAVCVC